MQQGEQRPEQARRLGDGVPPPTPYARTRRQGDATVVELRGEIDLGSAGQIDTHLTAAAGRPEPALVVLDLGAVEFIDCYGLSLLVRARQRVLERGGRVRMVCAHRPTRKLLALTGLDGLFHPVGTLDEALRP